MSKISFAEKIKNLFKGGVKNESFFDDLTDNLIEGDIGAKTAFEISELLEDNCKKKHLVSDEEILRELKFILSEYVKETELLPQRNGLNIWMVLGVNGVGKTTSVAKLGNFLKKNGNSNVILASADTFRAAAVDQLCIWGERVGVPVVKQQMGSDPASVAYDTVSSAISNGADIVLIDTAGRLHNKVGLMNELTKIKNVVKKLIPEAPDDVMLVLDGSTGQNAYEQAKQFTKATEVTSLAITKLDGTAKGGVVIGISEQFKIPVKYIGLGEGMEDLQPFNRKEFVNSLFGE